MGYRSGTTKISGFKQSLEDEAEAKGMALQYFGPQVDDATANAIGTTPGAVPGVPPKMPPGDFKRMMEDEAAMKGARLAYSGPQREAVTGGALQVAQQAPSWKGAMLSMMGATPKMSSEDFKRSLQREAADKGATLVHKKGGTQTTAPPQQPGWESQQMAMLQNAGVMGGAPDPSDARRAEQLAMQMAQLQMAQQQMIQQSLAANMGPMQSQMSPEQLAMVRYVMAGGR